MLLRSTSTPVLGSLLPSFSESPNHHLSSEPHPTLRNPKAPSHHLRIPPLPLNCSSSSLIRPALESPGNSFRRSISEGNLVGLGANSDDHSSNSPLPKPPKCFKKTSKGSILETIPFFSLDDTFRCEDEDSDDGEEEEEEDFGRGNVGLVENSSSGLEESDHGSRFLNAYKSIGFVEEQARSGEMYLPRGIGPETLNIGFGGGGGSGGGDFTPVSFGRDGGDGRRQSAEEHYKNLVEENPGNPLFLRNYAEFLSLKKKDLAKSEELYSRAILADPGDGEVLSQYAKLIWELHRDKDRALNYFERAVQAAPADSHVQAAYASFLWEIEGDGEEDESSCCSSVFNSHFYDGAMASAST